MDIFLAALEINSNDNVAPDHHYNTNSAPAHTSKWYHISKADLFPCFTRNSKIYWHLVVFRCFAILSWLGASLFDTAAYFRWIPHEFGFRFAYNLNFVIYETSIIIYASCAPAMGVGIECSALLIVSIINLIAAKINCEWVEVEIAIFWIVKTILLILGTKLAHVNFVKSFPKSYLKAFNSSASNMLHQALLFSITMLFLMAPGFRAIWDAADEDRHCNYTNQTCHFFNMLRPVFHEGDICEIHHIEYLKGREELRILRTFMILNIVSYSVYNQPLLQIGGVHRSTWYYLIKLITILSFIALSLALLVTCTHPFKYPSVKYIFDYMEMSIVVLTIFGLFANIIYFWTHKTENNDEDHEEMESEPHILPHH